MSTIVEAAPQLIASATLHVDTPGAGFTDITENAVSFVTQAGAGEGVLLIYLRHTSASLTIQENADPDVQADLVAALDRLARGRTVDSRCGRARRHAGSCQGDAQWRVSARACRCRQARARRLGRESTLIEHRRKPHSREIILQFIGSSNVNVRQVHHCAALRQATESRMKKRPGKRGVFFRSVPGRVARHIDRSCLAKL